MASYGLKSLILEPTEIINASVTCIDNIFSNTFDIYHNKYKFAIVQSSRSGCSVCLTEHLKKYKRTKTINEYNVSQFIKYMYQMNFLIKL